jgi:WD40 repeat protein
MLVNKTHSINHGLPINSIDVSPNGQQLASAGSDTSTKIWDIKYFQNKNLDDGLLGPKLLFILREHSAEVKCVRYSPNGHFLATCSVDSVVIVYREEYIHHNLLDTVINWIPFYTFRTHIQDVLCLSWSPIILIKEKCVSLLASTSFDNTVRVHNPIDRSTVSELKGHPGILTSVSFDPLGKYLASLGNDAKVRIWSTDRWKIVKVIVQTSFQIMQKIQRFSTRLAWSIDGSFLVVPNSIISGKSSTVIIKRDLISSKKIQRISPVQLLSQRSTCVCVSFSSYLFNRVNLEFMTMFALSCTDSTLSIWLINSSKPYFSTKKKTYRSTSNRHVLEFGWSSFVS